MIYKILETKISEDTTITVVEYDIEGTIINVVIPHFMPKSESDIMVGIYNRFITEKRKLFPDLELDAKQQVENYSIEEAPTENPEADPLI